ncbi:MAG: hypothetical protein CBD97_01755 [Pelagibacteraceae bacterium TMED237]|nr:MAG: hypothetical protein CBD97_01755 [Pelagibacteraceae bacterium TMED237]
MSNWGGANRPITSNKLGSPNPREGSDGDMQVRQTNLGAKIFAKVGGRWHESPLSREGVTKIGANISDYLSIDSDSVDVFKNDSKVASFGETTTLGDISTEHIEITSSHFKIKDASTARVTIDSTGVTVPNILLTGKIKLTSSGNRNICLGLDNADTGDDNISIGSLAGEDNGANSARNVFIGTNAGLENVDSRDNVGIGTNALRDVKGISSDPYNGETVAIGAYAGEKMDRGYGNVLVGYASGRNLESSNSAGAYQNTFIGRSAGASDTTTSQSVYIGVSADGSSNTTQNEIVIGANADGQGANYAVIGNGSISRLYANEDGDGVLYANGTIVSSDRRVKDNIEDIDLGLNFINKISPIKYTKRQLKDYDQSLKEKLHWYNKKEPKIIEDKEIEKKQLGFIAQDVETVLKGLGFNDNNNIVNVDDVTTKYSINYTSFIVPLTKAIQELSAKVDTMQTEINNLKG